MKLKGHHIFTTGGADGIGAACVLDAAEAGAKVSFCDIVMILFKMSSVTTI